MDNKYNSKQGNKSYLNLSIKIICFILVFVCFFGLLGCSRDSDDDSQANIEYLENYRTLNVAKSKYAFRHSDTNKARSLAAYIDFNRAYSLTIYSISNNSSNQHFYILNNSSYNNTYRESNWEGNNPNNCAVLNIFVTEIREFKDFYIVFYDLSFRYNLNYVDGDYVNIDPTHPQKIEINNCADVFIKQVDSVDITPIFN